MSIKKCLCLLLVEILYNVLAFLSVVDKGVTPLEKDSVAIQFYIDIDNKNQFDVCRYYTRVQKCILYSSKENCVPMNVFSENVGTIQPQDCKRLIYVFPTLYGHDLVGFCKIILAYHCNGTKRRRDRMVVNIPFDTRTNGKFSFLLKRYTSNEKPENCETIDQNSLNECLPVNCDLKYFGFTPFYSSDIQRCIAAPICAGNSDRDLPDIAYDPQINICTDFDLPLTIQDIYAISTGVGTVVQSSKYNDFLVKLKSNCSTISQNLYLLRDLLYGKLCPCDKGAKIYFGDGCKSAVFNIIICIISVCAVLLSFVCCVNTTVWVHRQWADGTAKEFMSKVRSKFKRTEKYRKSCKNHDVRNSLLREVIVKDIPLELRDSIVSICDRMKKEVGKKKRYRFSDLGSQVSLRRTETALKKHSGADSSDDT